MDNNEEEQPPKGTKRPQEDPEDDDDDDDDDDNADSGLDPGKRREVKKMRRVMANRRSARESRERKKKMLTDLQESVEGLTSENSSLTKDNLVLRRELTQLVEQAGGPQALGSMPQIQALLLHSNGPPESAA